MELQMFVEHKQKRWDTSIFLNLDKHFVPEFIFVVKWLNMAFIFHPDGNPGALISEANNVV